MADSWLGMTAAALGREIGAGRADPRDITETFLAAIDSHEHAQRIFARLTPERARDEAQSACARARSGMRRSPLDGVPISWKDLFDTAGIATEAGSRLLAGRTPDTDAAVLSNATSAGLVCLGKTHMTELAFSGLGYNPVTASPPCVNDHDTVSGGSSSGAATSVAFGLAAAGIGSDTGGSVRVPAAWNDLVGLKTTPGRLPLTGVVPLCPRFDTIGPLCRSVEDAALLLAALEGSQPADLRGSGLSGIRLLVLESVALDALEEGPRAGFEDAVEKLARAGARIGRAPVAVVPEAMALAGVLFATEAYGTWRDEIERSPDLMFPPVRERFRSGAAHSGADYVAAWQRLDLLRAAWAEATAEYDAVVVPTCPIMPPRIADLAADGAYFTERNLLTLRNTRIGNLFGLAGLTLPTAVPSAGITLLGGPGSEERLLRLGAAAEPLLA